MYENNNPNSDSESSTYRYTPERGTQSIYTGSSQSGYIPGSDSAVPPEPPKPPKNRKGLTAGKIIAIALACSLLGGCLGVGATILLRDNKTDTDRKSVV